MRFSVIIMHYPIRIDSWTNGSGTRMFPLLPNNKLEFVCDDINQTDDIKIYRDKFRLPISGGSIQIFQRIYEKQIGVFKKNELNDQDITSFNR